MVNHHLIERREEMEQLSNMESIKKTDTGKMQEYMKQKSLENSRFKFLWETNILESRCNIKDKCQKDKYQCPHCREGSQPGGSLETSPPPVGLSTYLYLT